MDRNVIRENDDEIISKVIYCTNRGTDDYRLNGFMKNNRFHWREILIVATCISKGFFHPIQNNKGIAPTSTVNMLQTYLFQKPPFLSLIKHKKL